MEEMKHFTNIIMNAIVNILTNIIMNAIVKNLTNIIMSTIMIAHAAQKNMSTRCGCHHHHHEEGGLKSKLFLIGATIILLIIAIFIEKGIQVWLPYSYAPRLSHSLFIDRTRDAGRSCRRYCQGRYV